jgi:hypothetical protein
MGKCFRKGFSQAVLMSLLTTGVDDTSGTVKKKIFVGEISKKQSKVGNHLYHLYNVHYT